MKAKKLAVLRHVCPLGPHPLGPVWPTHAQSSQDALRNPVLTLCSLEGLAWHLGKGIKENTQARKKRKEKKQQQRTM